MKYYMVKLNISYTREIFKQPMIIVNYFLISFGNPFVENYPTQLMVGEVYVLLLRSYRVVWLLVPGLRSVQTAECGGYLKISTSSVWSVLSQHHHVAHLTPPPPLPVRTTDMTNMAALLVLTLGNSFLSTALSFFLPFIGLKYTKHLASIIKVKGSLRGPTCEIKDQMIKFRQQWLKTDGLN